MDKNAKKIKKAKLKKRIYAFYVDLIVIGILQKMLVYSYTSCINELLTTIPKAQKSLLLGNTFQLTLITLSFTLVSYFMISYYFSHGKTIGKAMFNLRVYSLDNPTHELSFGETSFRTLAYLTCYLTGSLLFLVPLFTKDSKGLPDYFSHTEVCTDEEFAAYQLQEQAPQQDFFIAA